jgi:hypothetical protein
MTVNRKHFSTYDASIPKGVNVVRSKRWAWCENGDKTKVIFYKEYSLQGNSNKEIALRLKPYENCELIYFDKLYAPWDVNNEC